MHAGAVSAIGPSHNSASGAFGRLAAKTSQYAGRGSAFLVATAVVAGWAISGPMRYVTSAALAKRPGRLFIDFPRNGRGDWRLLATRAARLSSRGAGDMGRSRARHPSRRVRDGQPSTGRAAQEEQPMTDPHRYEGRTPTFETAALPPSHVARSQREHHAGPGVTLHCPGRAEGRNGCWLMRRQCRRNKAKAI